MDSCKRMGISDSHKVASILRAKHADLVEKIKQTTTYRELFSIMDEVRDENIHLISNEHSNNSWQAVWLTVRDILQGSTKWDTPETDN